MTRHVICYTGCRTDDEKDILRMNLFDDSLLAKLSDSVKRVLSQKIQCRDNI